MKPRAGATPLRVRLNHAIAGARGRLRGPTRFVVPAEQVRHHEPECNANAVMAERARGLYRARWPRHCRSCNGWGGRAFQYDPSPPGVALGPGYMLDFDPCQDCYAAFSCPRCALRHAWPGDSDGDGPCRRCGWAQLDAGDPHAVDPGLPEEWSCWGACDRQREQEEAERRGPSEAQREAAFMGLDIPEE